MNARKWFKRITCVLLAAITLLLMTAPALAVGQSSTLAKKGDVYYVVANGLHVRSSASIGDNIVRTIKKNTKVVFVSEKNGWWRISVSGKKIGYVDKQFLTRSNVRKTGTYKTTAALNVRSAPKSYALKLGTLKKGKSVKVVHLNGDWVQIKYNGGYAWVAAKYLKK